MIGNEGKKRPPRNPLSPEEVADFITVKRLREQLKLQRFKKTKRFKYLNVFNIVCFFIYCELLICFFSPCHYRTHFSKKVVVEYGHELNNYNQLKIAHLKITDVNDNFYQFIVNDFIEVPETYSSFSVGKDFILQKELKGTFLGSNNYYRIQRAEPFLFLSGFLGILLCIIFSYNLNQTESSLNAISVINGLTLLGFLMI
ncbi:MAG: hypothetical protein SFY56_14490 [Bacteroidota bacterium]|nr:hypothetical protein [Bacteroidota bacterium]